MDTTQTQNNSPVTSPSSGGSLQVNNPTQNLTMKQMQSNIDYYQSNKIPNDQIQNYANMYEKDADGNFVLKTSQAPVPNGTGSGTTTSTGVGGTLEGYSNNLLKTMAAPITASATNFTNDENNMPVTSQATMANKGEHLGTDLMEGAGGMIGGGIQAGIVKPLADAAQNIPGMNAIATSKYSVAAQAMKDLDAGGKVIANLWNKFASSNPDTADQLVQGGKVGQFMAMFAGDDPEAQTSANTVANKISEGVQTGTDAVKAGSDAVGGAVKSAAEIPGQVVDAVKGKAQDMATTLPQRIQSMIENADPEKAKELSQNLQDYFDQARAAMKTDKNGINPATPLETAGKTQISKALNTLKSSNPLTPGLLDEAGQTMNSELEGNTKPIDTTLAERALNANMQDRLGSLHESNFEPSKFGSQKESFDYIANLGKNTQGINSLNDEPVSGNIYNAPGRTSRIATPVDRNLVDAAYNSLDRIKNGNNTPKQIEDEVNILQNKLKKSVGTGAKPEYSPAQGVVKDFVEKLKDSLNENSSDEYKSARSKYAELKPIYDDLQKAAGDKYKNAASMMKSVVTSPTSGTRSLFEKVQNATGVNLFDHANMAKFAMDAAGDTRGGSLLENTANGAKTLTKLSDLKLNQPLQIKDYLQQLLANPEGKAIRALTKKGSSAK